MAQPSRSDAAGALAADTAAWTMEAEGERLPVPTALVDHAEPVPLSVCQDREVRGLRVVRPVDEIGAQVP